MAEDIPGAGANIILRVIAVAELIASALLALWLLIEFGSTWDPVIRREVSSPLGPVLATAVVVQGVIIAALFFALAGMGDNLIAIRKNTARMPVLSSKQASESTAVGMTNGPEDAGPVREHAVPFAHRADAEAGHRIEALSREVFGDPSTIRRRLGIPYDHPVHAYLTEREASEVIADLETKAQQGGAS